MLFKRILAACVALCAIASTAHATTLKRAGVEAMTAGNGTIVVAEVLDARSRWTLDGRFIVTDVRIAALDVLKGPVSRGAELSVTLLGGTIGDMTAMIVSGAQLQIGKRYVLFLSRDDLPGMRNVLTTREHAQGVFEIVEGRDGVRAVSQIDAGALLPDAMGRRDVPGGAEGLPLQSLLATIRQEVRK